MIYKLNGKIQHYGWGGQTFLPNLIGVENTKNEPFAELWMGTHTKGPSTIVINGKEESLTELIAASPESVLGEMVAARFDNKLPFLFKILDVNDMLSIQSHPTKKAAEIGFEKENQLGIPVTAKNRNYRDDNHKPEIMVALTDFWLLHGFKAEAEIRKTLEETTELNSLLTYFEEESIFDLYKVVMELPQAEVNALLVPLKERLVNQSVEDKSQPDFWAKRAFEHNVFSETDEDRGIISIYLMNICNLKEGEGIFQDAGILHAYLEGVNVELMANSDNVFRGGLTYKHVDVPELLKHLSFDAVVPKVLTGEAISDSELVYKSPAPDFELSKIDIEDVESLKSETCEILIVTKGTVNILNNETALKLNQGEVVFIGANTSYQLQSNEAQLFKASVGL